jgi:transmembrane sensor
MTAFPHRFDPATEEQASLWAARLDGGELSPADRATLESWLSADPARRALLSAYCQFSADLEQQMPLLEGIRGSAADTRPMVEETARLKPWWRWPRLAGAMLTAAAAVALLLWAVHPSVQNEDLATPLARRGTLALSDGTTVELNARTSLHARLDRQERHVRLAEGEAFFSVSRDPARPFFVETPAGSVRVTGTHFNVRAESPGTLEVTVEEGSVQARPAGPSAAAIALRAGDQLTSGPGGVAVRKLSAAALADSLSWRQGQVVFNGTPLREALARFARYHGRSFTATAAAGELKVGGRYSLDDVDGFLAFFEETLPLKVARDPGGDVHVSLRSER